MAGNKMKLLKYQLTGREVSLLWGSTLSYEKTRSHCLARCPPFFICNTNWRLLRSLQARASRALTAVKFPMEVMQAFAARTDWKREQDMDNSLRKVMRK